MTLTWIQTALAGLRFEDTVQCAFRSESRSKSESELNPDSDTNSDPDAWRTFSAVICCLLTVNEHSLTFLTVVNESHDQVVKPVIRYLEAFSCPVNLSPFDFMT